MRKQVTELHSKNVRSNKVNLLNNMCYARASAPTTYGGNSLPRSES